MTVSTDGVRVKSGSQTWRSLVELLSSMRFAISLLTLICIASVIGTVLKQHEPLGNYINQFGPFWTQVFEVTGLTGVYSAWWFMLILGFLVVSTSLCIARNTPKIITDLRSHKENIRAKSLAAFHHRATSTLTNETPEAAAQRIGKMLAGGGWRVKLQQREATGKSTEGAGWMVAARAGAVNKLGYIAAHSAIVLVCIGGLLDGDLIVRAQMWLGGKTAYNGGGMIADVKPEHRLPPSNPTFRGNILVSEGSQASTAILNQGEGVVLQDLPFSIELKKFIVEYYSTGMPKLFASDIVLHDRETGATQTARVEVNHPSSYRGVEIYQSSFDDGGSTVTLQALPMQGEGKPFEIEGVIGSSSQLSNGAGGEQLTLEYTALRVINVENLGANKATSGADTRAVNLGSSINARLGAANKPDAEKVMHNVGPSITYKLRDGAGQAREFHNYMLPVDTGDGVPVYLYGLRENPSDPFRYLRIPADEEGGVEGFMRLRAALKDAKLRDLALQRYAAKAVDPKRPELAQQLAASAGRALALFAGVEGANPQQADGRPVGGLQAIADFMEANVPEAERTRASEVLVRILNGVLFELTQISRERADLAPLQPSEKTQGFMTQSVLSLSDIQIYPAPMAFELRSFNQVQASVFQVTRAPGKNVVYLGCAFLILGVFAMLYIRERRVWVWLAPTAGGGTEASMALSTNRKTLDSDHEFEMLKTKLIGAKDSHE